MKEYLEGMKDERTLRKDESIVLKCESEFLNRMSNFVQNKYQKLVTLMYINICILIYLIIISS